MRALLGRDDNDPDLSVVEPELGDRYLLCSDGLPDMVDTDLIATALGAETIDLAATELVRLALEGGGHDNVTVVIGEMVDANDPIDDTLSCADGRPQLVGAAASQPRPRTGADLGKDREPVRIDPEEARYAPRPPARLRWLKWLIGVIVIAAILAGVGKIAYDWSQKQYFVASNNGYVTIYRGVQADVPGLALQHVTTVTKIKTSSLSDFRQKQVRAGIDASSLKDAREIVANLEAFLPPAPTPTPSNKPKPTDKPTQKTTTAALGPFLERL